MDKGAGKARAAWLAQHVLTHEPVMRKWLARRSIGGLEIDDIIQETYTIIAGLESVEDIRNPRNYAFQVAYSLIRAHFKRARVVAFHSFGDIDALGIESSAPSPERAAIDREFLRSVEHYLADLPSNCRAVILMSRVHELSRREIAAQLGISENAVQNLLTKAILLLLEAFGRGGKRAYRTSIEVTGSSQQTAERPDENQVVENNS